MKMHKAHDVDYDDLLVKIIKYLHSQCSIDVEWREGAFTMYPSNIFNKLNPAYAIFGVNFDINFVGCKWHTSMLLIEDLMTRIKKFSQLGETLCDNPFYGKSPEEIQIMLDLAIA